MVAESRLAAFWRRSPGLSGLLACIIVCLAGCDHEWPGKPNPANRPELPTQVMSFTAIYQRNCAGCHGPDGKQGAAPALNDPLFRGLISASELEATITKGRPGTPMPAFLDKLGGALTAKQIQVLVDGIKGIPHPLPTAMAASESNRMLPWGAVAPVPVDTPAYTLPKSPGDAKKGAMIFDMACAICHGPDGKGVVQNDRRLNPINNSAFLSLISDQAIRRIIITGRPDLKMPSYSDGKGRSEDFFSLSSNDIADLGALLASWRTAKANAEK